MKVKRILATAVAATLAASAFAAVRPIAQTARR